MKEVSRSNRTSKKLRKKRYIALNPRNTFAYLKKKEMLTKYGLINAKELGKYTFLTLRYKNVMRKYNVQSPVYKEVYQKLCDYDIIEEDSYAINQIKEENFLKRRFQTIISKKYEITPLAARQKITQGFAYFKNRRRKICSFLIKKSNEKDVELRL